MNEMLVIDIGGTKTNVSLVGEFDLQNIKILSSEIFKTHSNPEHTIQKITSIYNNQGLKLESISLSLPGKWDEDGVLKESYYLHDWLNYPFIANLKNELKIKNIIWETDVICGALGEYEKGKYNGKSLLYINLGTGIGGALIKDGKPVGACHGKPTLRMQKLVFSCDEVIYSAVDLISGGGLIKHISYKSVEELYNAYKKVNVEAVDLISRAQYQLAAWIINLFYLFGPDVIVLNGGLTYDWEVLCEEAVEIANEELNNQVKIIPSKLKDMAPVYGAYVNAKPKSLLLTQGSVS